MEVNNKKIGFFEKMKIAIFKLEDYGVFLGEKFGTSLKYFFILILLLSIVTSLVDTYKLNKMLTRVYSYITRELPDFEYSDNGLSFNEKIDAYDNEFKFKLLVDTDENVSDEQIKDYKTKVYNNDYGLILLKDKAIYIEDGNESDYSYKDIEKILSQKISNKQEFIDIITKTGIGTISSTFFVMELIIVYIENAIIIIGDVLLVAIFGLIASRLCGLRFRPLPMVSLSVYAITLSVLLSAVYGVIYGLIGFEIKYFSVMYLLIAYVYIVAAILMIKYDLIKQHFELEKILEVQKKVHEEMKKEEDKENDTENEDKENKDDEENREDEKEDGQNKDESDEDTDINTREPDGSEI